MLLDHYPIDPDESGSGKLPSASLHALMTLRTSSVSMVE